MKKRVEIFEGEYWWGGSSAMADELPISRSSDGYALDMYRGYNQTMPLYVSSRGRYIWGGAPMRVEVVDGAFLLECQGDIELSECGDSLREAYLGAMKKHFPFDGKHPPIDFFKTAQYNTWMVLDYHQSEEGVLRYAHEIIDNGYEPGIFIIDEGWHGRYGLWEFDLSKFPHPKEMIDELHSLGFKVMLWLVPLVSLDGKEFIMSTEPSRRRLIGGGGDDEYFLRTDAGDVAIVKWWNGYSAILNMCREEDRRFLDSKLRLLMDEYGVDGFKLDGGVIGMYSPKNVVNGAQTRYTADELNIAWNEFGERYEYHEYKDTYGRGGKPVIQRLRDRDHVWGDNGLRSLIPAALCAGLIGHPFICPDMVGGGEWSYNYKPEFRIDEELFVRMAECSALFPMIQFSWEPWRKLGKEGQKQCLAAARLHSRYGEYIADSVREAAVSGEPILRHLEYAFPHSGFESVSDQFMLGERLLVCPVTEQGAKARAVKLPEGKWRYTDGTEYVGGCEIEVDAPLGVLPYFERILSE